MKCSEIIIKIDLEESIFCECFVTFYFSVLEKIA